MPIRNDYKQNLFIINMGIYCIYCGRDKNNGQYIINPITGKKTKLNFKL